MRNNRKAAEFWIGIAAIILSIIAVGVSMSKMKPLVVDWMGVLVGILAILVTVLIGWQIYTMLDAKREIKEIRHEIEVAFRKVDTECGILSVSVYSALFDEIRQKKENIDVYSYFKYGLLVILHAQSINNVGLCKSMIRVLVESFPVTKAISNREKADVLIIAAKISETSIRDIFDDLHKKLIVDLKSSD